MRALLMFLGLMVTCMLAGAFLAYPAYLLLHPLNPDWPFHRIANRISMLLLAIGMFWLLKHLGVNNRRDLGYGLQRPRFIRQMLAGLWIGALTMLPVMALLFVLDIRMGKPGLMLNTGLMASVLLKSMLAGFVVAFIEETLLRGALHAAVEHESGTRMAVVLTALVYAAAHFLNSTRIAHENVQWSSSLDLLSGAVRAFAQPAVIVDSFLALFAVGVLLSLVRVRTGSIAAGIGLHAGWVWVIASVRELSVRNPETAWGSLVGSYDGVVGYLVLGWTVLICLLFWKISARFNRAPLASSS